VILDVGKLIIETTLELHKLVFKFSLSKDKRKVARTFGWECAYRVGPKIL